MNELKEAEVRLFTVIVRVSAASVEEGGGNVTIYCSAA